jgi:hypothetical protein
MTDDDLFESNAALFEDRIEYLDRGPTGLGRAEPRCDECGALADFPGPQGVWRCEPCMDALGGDL